MPRRSGRITNVLLCLGLSLPLALAGCVQGGGVPYTLSPLHVEGLQPMPGLTSLFEFGYAGFAIYQGAGDAAPRVLVNTGSHLDVVGLDGSGDRHLAMHTECQGPPAVSADGRWGACLGYNAGFTSSTDDRLEIVSLAAGSTRHHQFTLSDSADAYFDLAWSPDGSHLALVASELSNAGQSCAVEVYTAGPDYGSLTLASRFTSDAFVYASQCHVSGLGWSSDGSQLEIVAQSPDALLLDDGVYLTSPELGPGASLTIPAEQFVSFPVGYKVSRVAQNPRTRSFALNGSGHTLMYYSEGTQLVGTWLTMPDTGHVLSNMAWMPDGQQLLLEVDGPYCLDNCSHASPDLYLYTPPTTN